MTYGLVCRACKRIRCDCALVDLFRRLLPTRAQEGWDDGLLAKLIGAPEPPKPCPYCAKIMEVLGTPMLCYRCDPNP